MRYTLILLLLSGCTMTSPPMQSWIAYTDACTARATSNILPLCPAFPFPPNDKGRGEAIGAAINAAQGIGEFVVPLAVSAIAGQEAAK